MPNFDNIKYKNDFNREFYDRCSLMLPKGEKAELQAIAQAHGQSLNAYIIEAIKEKRERDELAQSCASERQLPLRSATCALLTYRSTCRGM